MISDISSQSISQRLTGAMPISGELSNRMGDIHIYPVRPAPDALREGLLWLLLGVSARHIPPGSHG